MARAIGLGLILAGVMLAPQVAAAGDFDGCGPGWFGYGYYPPSVYVSERIPHFALHPPVYYSVPVPRTYGYSPFAYPPGVKTPEVVVEPLTITNPYVPQKPTPATPSNLTVQPLRIQNPYFDGASATETNVASAPRPQIVYPMATK